MPNTIFKLIGGTTETDDATRQVTVICSTEAPDRIGDVVVQTGIELDNYRTNPVVLWSHDSDMPVARAPVIGVQDGVLRSTVQFPPAGEDADSDWVYGKIKNRLVNAVSIGFIPKTYEPVDPQEPWDGYRFMTCELVEFSFCTVPMNAEALIVGRSLKPPKLHPRFGPPSKAMDPNDPDAPHNPPPDPGVDDPDYATDGKDLASEGMKWVCPNCDAKNPAEGDSCFNCGSSRPSDPGSGMADGDGGKAFDAAIVMADLAIAQLAAFITGFKWAIGITGKAGRVISAANEERLRAAHTAIGAVLDQIAGTDQPEDPQQQSLEVRPRRADVEGRSEAVRFPLRTAREVELLKLRSA